MALEFRNGQYTLAIGKIWPLKLPNTLVGIGTFVSSFTLVDKQKTYAAIVKVGYRVGSRTVQGDEIQHRPFFS